MYKIPGIGESFPLLFPLLLYFTVLTVLSADRKTAASDWHYPASFSGSHARIHIKAKRFDDVLTFVTKIKKEKPAYDHKCDTYLKKIGDLMSKVSEKTESNGNCGFNTHHGHQ